MLAPRLNFINLLRCLPLKFIGGKNVDDPDTILDHRHAYVAVLSNCSNLFNPLERSGVRWLHFKVSSAIQV